MSVLILICSLAGLIQSLIIFVLSLCGILYVHRIIEPTYDNEFLFAFYTTFLVGVKDQIVKRSIFEMFLWIYFFFSFFWFLASSFLVWGSTRKKMAILKNILLTWSILSLFISLWDLILTILLSIDIHHYIVSHNEIQHGFAYFISIILSSKCVILWIINIVMAILIIKLYIDLNKNNCQQSRRTFLYAYPNNNFTEDYVDNRRSDSEFGTNSNYKSPLAMKNENLKKEKYNQYNNEMNKKMYNNPRIHEPYIPRPDYTPPSSPYTSYKSILKKY